MSNIDLSSKSYINFCYGVKNWETLGVVLSQVLDKFFKSHIRC